MTSSDPDFSEPMTFEIEFCQPDPEVLDILTGGAFSKDTPTKQPVFGMEIVVPIKRTFWQWLLRKPRQHRTIYVPRVRIEGS